MLAVCLLQIFTRKITKNLQKYIMLFFLAVINFPVFCLSWRTLVFRNKGSQRLYQGYRGKMRRSDQDCWYRAEMKMGTWGNNGKHISETENLRLLSLHIYVGVENDDVISVWWHIIHEVVRVDVLVFHIQAVYFLLTIQNKCDPPYKKSYFHPWYRRRIVHFLHWIWGTCWIYFSEIQRSAQHPGEAFKIIFFFEYIWN